MVVLYLVSVDYLVHTRVESLPRNQGNGWHATEELLVMRTNGGLGLLGVGLQLLSSRARCASTIFSNTWQNLSLTYGWRIVQPKHYYSILVVLRIISYPLYLQYTKCYSAVVRQEHPVTTPFISLWNQLEGTHTRVLPRQAKRKPCGGDDHRRT